jgi:hypothetical protein
MKDALGTLCATLTRWGFYIVVSACTGIAVGLVITNWLDSRRKS